MIDLPKYHLLVGAFEIGSVEYADDERRHLIIRSSDGMHFRDVTRAWADRHGPHPGAFFVVHQDGMSTVTPHEAFLRTFTECEANAPR